MYGETEMFNALNVSSITSTLDTYQSQPALFNDTLVPQDFLSDKSINFYRSTSSNLALEYGSYTFTLNCRAATQNESTTIATAVTDSINRTSYSNYYIVCNIIGTIPPLNDTDNYNTPIEAILKKK